jgi:BspA type Leucine rich repeat region (6 copies)
VWFGCWLIAAGLFLLLLPAVVQAQYYYATNNNEITITEYYCSSNTVVIPDTINGLPVTSIGDGAFSYCPNLTSLLIPTSVTDIGYEAFAGSTNLTVTIYGDGTIIGSDPFSYRDDLTSVVISNGVTGIEGYAFYSCPNLTSLLIPTSVTGIGSFAFYGCTNLTVTIYGDGAIIGSNPFSYRDDLTSVVISNGITVIGGYAFYSCPNLTSLLIPTSVASIGSYAFYGCTSLKAITVDANNSVYSSVDGVLFNKSQTMLIQYPAGKAGSYAIPSGVTDIGSDAFAWCANLTAVYFLGNAPSGGSDSSLFAFDNIAAVYYLPGTTGWGSTFGGLPAVSWNPQAQDLGVQANQFGFTITGSSNLVVVVEACTNLANAVWIPLATNTLTGGTSQFSDPQWANYPSRFYRFRAP